MKTKIAVSALIVSVVGLFAFATRTKNAMPSDFRDAPKGGGVSEGQLTGLAQERQSSDVIPPTPMPPSVRQRADVPKDWAAGIPGENYADRAESLFDEGEPTKKEDIYGLHAGLTYSFPRGRHFVPTFLMVGDDLKAQPPLVWSESEEESGFCYCKREPIKIGLLPSQEKIVDDLLNDKVCMPELTRVASEGSGSILKVKFSDTTLGVRFASTVSLNGDYSFRKARGLIVMRRKAALAYDYEYSVFFLDLNSRRGSTQALSTKAAGH